MDGVSRIGVSLEPELLIEFDKSISKKGYVSRSEAIRDLVRDSLSESDWKNENIHVAGTLVVVIDIDATDVYEKIANVCRKRSDVFVHSSNYELGEGKAMQVLVTGGKLKDLKSFMSDISSVKGVLRSKLTMIAPSSGNLHHIGVRNK